MDVSDRINTTIEMVTTRGTVADIGCDHCLSLISLIKSGRCKKGIGSDIKKGPLDKARKNIKANGLGGLIELRQGNGLTTIALGEADTVIIAGMGGLTINSIINESAEVAKSAAELILQPHTDICSVRENLHFAGFKITEEKMICERGKFYVTIKAAEGAERYVSKAQYMFGKLLIDARCVTLYNYLTEELRKNTYITHGLQDKKTESCELRITEFNDMNKLIKEVLKCL